MAWADRLDNAVAQWYYASDGQSVGPIDSSELRELLADSPDTYINPTTGNLWLPYSALLKAAELT